MCGIAGIALKPNRTLPDLKERLVTMRDSMHHRGPDDAGLFTSADGRVGLANRRLAIRDLSPAGHMPMSSADGHVWITYNGEIYNAGELRAELKRLGYAFRSTSDTEVVLHGYKAWGQEVVQWLRGMFAFAILDHGQRWAGDSGTPNSTPAAKQLFLARDRLGIKPLYFAVTPEAFAFASELKALQTSGLVGRQVNPASVVAYLMLGSVPCPLTIYQGVQALEPGCTLTLDLTTECLSPLVRRYWKLPADTIEPQRAGDAVEQVRELLKDAVSTHLVSDVPLGAFLSGGLDSSSVVALMRAVTDGPIRTCSMLFEEAAYNEAPYAGAVAENIGAEHHTRVITAQDVEDELDNILWAMDQPTVDGVNTYFVSKTAREAGLTVALSGLGGDELFGGYANTFQAVPRLTRGLRLAHKMPGGATLARTGVTRLSNHGRWTKVADALSRPPSPASAYLACRGLFAPSEVQALVTPDVWKAAAEDFDPVAYIAETTANSLQPSTFDLQPFAWVSRAELRTYTHHQLLRDTDVMSMAHSLEVRVPLLDHRLVEAVLRLPASAKVNGTGPKALLVKAVGDLLPPVVRNRREKQGFTFPFDAWLRGPLRDRYLASEGSLNGWLRAGEVGRIHHAHERGRVHWSRPWALAVLGSWVAADQG